MSLVWNFFTKNAEKAVVTCQICDAHLKWNSSSTGAMLNHLKLKHPTKISEGANKSGSIEQYCVRKRSTCSEEKSRNLTQLILNFIYKDLYPIRFVKSESLKELMNYVEPNCYTGQRNFCKVARKTVQRR